MDTNTRPTATNKHGRRNRRHTIEFKRAVVAQSYLPGSSVSLLARHHDVNANQIFAWRKLYREASLMVSTANTAVLLPVKVISPAAGEVTTPAKAQTQPVGTMELAIGNARLTICGSPDADVLRMVLAHLLR